MKERTKKYSFVRWINPSRFGISPTRFLYHSCLKNNEEMIKKNKKIHLINVSIWVAFYPTIVAYVRLIHPTDWERRIEPTEIPSPVIFDQMSFQVMLRITRYKWANERDKNNEDEGEVPSKQNMSHKKQNRRKKRLERGKRGGRKTSHQCFPFISRRFMVMRECWRQSKSPKKK